MPDELHHIAASETKTLSDEGDGLIFAGLLDGKGGAKSLDWTGVRACKPGRRALWVHLDRHKEPARRWLMDEAGLPEAACDALLMAGSRPHVSVFPEGLLIVLRGVNLNPGADPEDMVSLRLWVDRGRVISLRRRKVMAIQDVHDLLVQGVGPKNPAELITRLAGKLIDRMRPVLTSLDDDVDALESQVLTSRSKALRHRMHAIRHKVIELRRHIAPQRDALAQLIHADLDWLDGLDLGRLREIADRLSRFIEDLDSARERAKVVQDELSTRLAEEMNRAMYVLSIVATVFLPLGFVTGLLGVNLGGIPGTASPYAFALLCGLLLAVGGLEIWLFKRLKWL